MVDLVEFSLEAFSPSRWLLSLRRFGRKMFGRRAQSLRTGRQQLGASKCPISQGCGDTDAPFSLVHF